MTEYKNIKLTSSFNPPSEDFKAIPKDKRKAEFLIVSYFAQYLIFNDIPVEKVELNKDDSNKGADVIMNIKNQEVGVQLTRFTLHDLIQRQEIAKKRNYEIVELLLPLVNIDFKLNIHINPVNTNDSNVPINKQNLKKSLAIEISHLINSNIEILKTGMQWLHFDLKDSNSIR